jgi:hypothetical protein
LCCCCDLPRKHQSLSWAGIWAAVHAEVYDCVTYRCFLAAGDLHHRKVCCCMCCCPATARRGPIAAEHMNRGCCMTRAKHPVAQWLLHCRLPTATECRSRSVLRARGTQYLRCHQTAAIHTSSALASGHLPSTCKPPRRSEGRFDCISTKSAGPGVHVYFSLIMYRQVRSLTCLPGCALLCFSCVR